MKKEKEIFPGYPHYSKNEDIYNKERETNIDPESLEDSGKYDEKASLKEPIKTVPELKNSKDEEIKNPKLDSDLTAEDLDNLGEKNDDQDMGEDDRLKKTRMFPVDFSGEGLDVPGSEIDDADEEIGKEDEENNFYSLPD